MAKVTLAPDGRLYSVSEHGVFAAGIPSATASDYRHSAIGGSSDIESSASMYELP